MVSEQFSYKGLYIFSVSLSNTGKIIPAVACHRGSPYITYSQSYLEGDVLNVIKLE